MINVLLVLVLLAIPSGILVYLHLRREKKKGAACIGCPHSRQCVNCGSTCSNKHI